VAKKRGGTVHNLQNLKLAQVHSKNLKIIQQELHRTVIALKPFLTYKMVQRVLSTVSDELTNIDIHLTKFDTIEKTKGEVKANE
jgi:hypothetical protein